MNNVDTLTSLNCPWLGDLKSLRRVMRPSMTMHLLKSPCLKQSLCVIVVDVISYTFLRLPSKTPTKNILLFHIIIDAVVLIKHNNCLETCIPATIYEDALKTSQHQNYVNYLTN